MLNHAFTGAFKKDRKLLKKQNKDMSKLLEVMNLIINGSSGNMVEKVEI